MRTILMNLGWLRALALAAAVCVALPLAAEPPRTPAHRVVIELTSDDRAAWDGVLNSIEALQQHLRPGAIEVVVHGRAITWLENKGEATRGTIHDRVKRAASAGVTFAACENAMRRHGIDRSKLMSYATAVQSGVVEVVIKQEQGWSYLRAGL